MLDTPMKPVVSIGLPVYNGEKYLANAIELLLKQTFTNFELIISDNASTDKTAEICQEYANRDKRIIYFKQLENIGASRNFEFVLRKAQSKYFMWAAFDDEWSLNYVECLVNRLLISNERLDFVYSRHTLIDADSHELQWKKPILGVINEEGIFGKFFRPDCYMPKLYNACIFFLRANCMAIYGMYRTEILNKRNPLFVTLGNNVGGADVRFLMEIILNHNIAYVADSLFKYRFILKSLDCYTDIPFENKDLEYDFDIYVEKHKDNLEQAQEEMANFTITPLREKYPFISKVILFIFSKLRIRRYKRWLSFKNKR